MSIGTIGFENYKIHCILGELPEERVYKQDVFVDLNVGFDFSRCEETDDINDTINYVELAEVCSSIAHKNEFRMLESYASKVITEVLARFPVEWVWIKIKKPKGIDGANFSFVELKKCRK